MFSRMLEHLPLRARLPIPSPRFIPSTTRPQCRSITQLSSQRPRPLLVQTSKSLFTPHVRYSSNRPEPQWLRYAPQKAAEAEPLVTEDQASRFLRNPITLLAGISLLVSGSVFYMGNIEEVPVSGRRRFNCYSEETVESEGESTYHILMNQHGNHILPDWDRRSMQVQRVMTRLIPASGTTYVAWKVHVIDSSEKNGFVLPGGYVFVYSGMLEITQSDDGLAAVLGHEIAHNLAKHPAEKLSHGILLLPLRFMFILAGSFFSLGSLGDLAFDLGIMRRSSRQQESEADLIGLMIMAKSCYDPSAAVAVWQRFQAWQKSHGSEVPEWLSTHPSSSTRVTQLRALIPQAEEARLESGCSGTLAFSDGFHDTIEAFGFKWPGRE